MLIIRYVAIFNFFALSLCHSFNLSLFRAVTLLNFVVFSLCRSFVRSMSLFRYVALLNGSQQDIYTYK